MSAQPEALRLADALIAATVQTDAEDDVIHVARWFVEDAAAELCRLSAVEAQRDALKQTLHDELAGNLRLRDLGGARPDEPMLTFLERIIAERDALLEALAVVLLEAEHTLLEPTRRKARAAIKAVEENT